MLVRGLVEHLNGAMTIETSPGRDVGFRIRLPVDGRLRHSSASARVRRR